MSHVELLLLLKSAALDTKRSSATLVQHISVEQSSAYAYRHANQFRTGFNGRSEGVTAGVAAVCSSSSAYAQLVCSGHSQSTSTTRPSWCL